MHHFIYATKDSWISSGSNADTTGISEKDQNYGQDPILELKKNFFNQSFDYQTRVLVHFNLTEVSQSVSQGKITSPRYYLRLYEAEGVKELSSDYTLEAFPISESWDEGTGKFGDNPKTTNGVSWENRNNYPGMSAVTWSNSDDGASYSEFSGLGVTYYDTGSGGNPTNASQSFSYESPDVNMDVTDIVNHWFESASVTNHGFLLKFSGSQETDNQTFGHFKFFSAQTHTIYPPKLEVRWDDHVACTGNNTGSLTELTSSGEADNYLYMKGLKKYYKETEKVKFRVGARKRYIQRRFNTSVQTITGSYIPEGSGSYSIIDIATGETIVPFSDYTKLSCDSTSLYFIQWLNGFSPDRVYKILYKVKYDDGQEQIFDDNFEFIVKR
jgi:hypothetical protein